MNHLNALYLCYFPIAEPLVQTQVVAYLRALADDGARIHLLTFETQRRNASARADIRRRLAADGITWHCLRYHRRPSLPATLWDIGIGTLFAAFLLRRYRINVLHARAYVPAAMALPLKRLFGVKMLFDVRGLLAEEYEDAGLWKRGDLKFRLTKRMERKFFAAADAVVVLTERIKAILSESNVVDPAKVTVIPCCVDLLQFPPSILSADSQRRAELRLTDQIVLVYLGKLGGWYMAPEMVDFFAVAREAIPNLHFMLLTQSDREIARREFARRGICEEAYTLATVPPGEVPSYLAAAHVGISFIRPCFSKLASSPTKLGEYLAAGLPVVANTGIGDADALLTADETGVLVEEFSDVAYRAAVARLQQLLTRGDEVRTRCRRLAEEHLSLARVGSQRYRAVYRMLGA